MAKQLIYNVKVNYDKAGKSPFRSIRQGSDKAEKAIAGISKAIQNQTKQLSAYSKRSDKLTKEIASNYKGIETAIEKIPNSLKDAMAAQKRFARASEGGSSFYKQVSEGSERAEKSIKETTRAIRDQIKFLDLQGEKGTVTNQELIESYARLERQLENLPQSYRGTVSAQSALMRSQRRMNATIGNTRGAVSGANQAVFSFGDILNDAQQFQYSFAAGSRAIGNNIGFLSEQFINIQGKTKGFKGAIKAIGSSLMGPAGIVLAINAAITVITVFGDKLFGASKEADKLEKELEELDSQAEVTISTLEEFGAFEFDQFGLVRMREELEQSREREQELLQKSIDLNKNKVDLLKIQASTQQYGVLKYMLGALGVQEESNDIQKQITAEQQQQSKLLEQIERQKNALQDIDVQAQRTAQRISEEVEQTVSMLASSDRFGEDPFGIAESRKQIELLQARLPELSGQLDARQVILSEINQIKDEIAFKTNNIAKYSLNVKNNLKEQESTLRNINAIKSTSIVTPTGDIITAEEQLANEAAQTERERVNAQQEALKKLKVDAAKETNLAVVALGKQRYEELSNMQEAQTALEKAENEQRLQYGLHAAQALGNFLTMAFEDNKAIAIAGALINAGAAITRQFKDLPIYAAIPAAALVAAKTAKQISQMKSIEPGSAGNVSESGGGMVEGFQTQTVNNMTAVAPQVDLEPINAENQPININLSGDIADESISVRAERGRKLRETNTLSIRSDR